MPSGLAGLTRIAPEVLFVPVQDAKEAAKEAATADAVIGFCTADIVRAGKGLRWIQVSHAGVEKDITPEVRASKVVLTNTQRLYGPNVADQAMALLLSLTRGVKRGPHSEYGGAIWDALKKDAKPQELRGKTMLVVGLGGIGTQIAQRAHGFGMRVLAIDPSAKLEKPAFG